MRMVQQSYEIIKFPENALQEIEADARTCYQSHDKITDESAEKLACKLIDKGHGAMLEFADVKVKFITNRGISHELVRHRPCSFAQESTRYVRYNDVDFIEPEWWLRAKVDQRQSWLDAMCSAEEKYTALLDSGLSPQDARGVLPADTKTEIRVKTNIREWRHIFSLRCARSAHPQMRSLLAPLLADFKQLMPVFFDDISSELLTV